MNSCPFCDVDAKLLAENEHAFAILDKYPVSPGHLLVVPKVHVGSIFDLPADAYNACLHLLKELKEQAEGTLKPDGFNVGVNCGKAAGQTIEHAHVHLIPRYIGDVQNSKGGVRNVIPGKGNY